MEFKPRMTPQRTDNIELVMQTNHNGAGREEKLSGES